MAGPNRTGGVRTREPVLSALRAVLGVARRSLLTGADMRWLAGLMREMADDIDPDVGAGAGAGPGRGDDGEPSGG